MGFLRLVRATRDNGVFRNMKAEWGAQLDASDDAPREYYSPMMEHAERISQEHPQDPKYGIFVLTDEDPGTGKISHEAMIHINHAWPKTKDATLRLVWNLVAPRYQFDESPGAKIAAIFTGLLTESLTLSGKDMPSKEVKVYLGNALDREYVTIAASFLGNAYPNFAFEVRGSWLHIKA